jgi:hypothetical protein
VSDTNPILATIRSLLKFKDCTTVSEIASIAGLTKKRVLDVLNSNGHMVWRNRHNGKITRVDPKGVLEGRLWASGSYFKDGLEDYGRVHTLEFKMHEELRDRLKQEQWGGGFGDSFIYTCVLDTPENRAALVADGCVYFKDLDPPLDDRLWKEDPS